ncbi:MAG: conjugative transfer signal peptidase TraF [bacterium]|nr:conjugative transfer signal peptidase TraF [bacterium]
MRRPRSWAPIWVVSAVAGLCVLFAGSDLRLNLTRSLPLGLYRFDEGPIERGVLVAACLQLEHAREGRRRGYLSRGSCPGGVSPVLKRVGATGGDVVAVTVESVFVGGELLQVAAPRTDSHGRSLTTLPVGEYRLALQELWLYTTEPRSWDSRFYGPVDGSAVLGRVQPVWTWGAVEDATDASGSNGRRSR